MKNRRAMFGLSAAMAIGLLTPVRDEDGMVTTDPEKAAEQELRLSIVAPEPAPEPRRHTGKREAARRLRQLAKRSA